MRPYHELDVFLTWGFVPGFASANTSSPSTSAAASSPYMPAATAGCAKGSSANSSNDGSQGAGGGGGGGGGGSQGNGGSGSSYHSGTESGGRHPLPSELAAMAYMQAAIAAFAQDPRDGLRRFGWPRYSPNCESALFRC